MGKFIRPRYRNTTRAFIGNKTNMIMETNNWKTTQQQMARGFIRELIAFHEIGTAGRPWGVNATAFLQGRSNQITRYDILALGHVYYLLYFACNS